MRTEEQEKLYEETGVWRAMTAGDLAGHFADDFGDWIDGDDWVDWMDDDVLGSPVAHAVAEKPLGDEHIITVRFRSGRHFNVTVSETPQASSTERSEQAA